MGNLKTVFKTYTDGNKEEGDSFLYGDNLFIIAEGLGGEYLSKIAKERACRIIHESFFSHLSETHSPGNALTYALEEANKDILNERRKLGEKMAASVCVAYIRDRIMYFSHLGDSRIYSLHGKELNQLTRDHTIQEEDPFAKAKYCDLRVMNALTDGLGIHDKPGIKVKKYPLNKSDLILMTTEGLTKRVSNREILRFTQKTKNPESLCNGLIDLANRKSGNGNMTIGIVKITRLSRAQRNVIITYSTFFLLILAAISGYSLKYGEEESNYDQAQVIQPTQESSASSTQKKISVVSNEITDPVRAIKEVKKQETEAVLFDKIFTFIRDWKAAWENTAGAGSDMDHYISFYSDDFSSGRIDKNRWKREKARKGRRKSWMRVELTDIKITGPTEDNQIEVRFIQDYRSSNYSEKSGKILFLKREDNKWKIIVERSY